MNSQEEMLETGALINSAYDELCVRFSGVHAEDYMDSILLRLHAALKKLGIDPTAPYIARAQGRPKPVAWRWRWKDKLENNPWRLVMDARGISHITAETQPLYLSSAVTSTDRCERKFTGPGYLEQTGYTDADPALPSTERGAV